ncbi:response regulator [Sulfurimonas sp.]|nr:response regulator [Sulfurimonas sp.]
MVDIKELKLVTKNLRVLYVEDDLGLQKSMKGYLQKYFHNVDTASNGLEGLNFYSVDKYDIVMTDISMPKMDSIEMIKKIREINNTQAILITTAHYESDYMHFAIKYDVDGYVVKPFDFEQLNYELFKTSTKINALNENEQFKMHLSEMVENQTKQLKEIIEYDKVNYEKILISLVDMIEKRDTYTAGHSRRVAKSSQMIAKHMGYSKEDCDLIYQAGILHDIGKIGTPDAVLLNPKSLNELEYTLIQEHSQIGYDLLHSIPIFENLADIIYAHHERFDGEGYPRKLKGDEIPPMSRIMIVADAFDAMTTNRIYKARYNIKEALQEIKKLSGFQFDPYVAEKAMEVLKDVELDDSINQLPKTTLEEERFAYFYKDSMSEVYNQNYFDVVLTKNSYDKVFNYMDIVFIKKFSIFNKEHGWDNGDKVLKELAQSLDSGLDNSLVFRIFGDDFVVLSKEQLDKKKFIMQIENTLKKHSIEYKVYNLDLNENQITNLSQIEAINI